ncbi:nuclear transport factor 2 family protein [Bradyrhizobium tropiciagri]|uniref:nuclear transport factor 2 family protein n=1 Tax=Bradyrhizobium tropiciagri TaxID=312253 RepID=UPI001BAA4DDD|nr:nuclear transport factor 2 family protein [Bradyrhizobium tropiciagri]MBR0869870.1 nuclear transport factor 2 family protein [Bradyrhizobium tropiciagri]
MSFDPMAAAVDWLDAYRARDLEDILGMYADDAVIYCGCGGHKTLTGRSAVRAYWIDRLKRYPAFALNDLQPKGNGVTISYITASGFVSAVLSFNGAGKIRAIRCGPAN